METGSADQSVLHYESLFQIRPAKPDGNSSEVNPVTGSMRGSGIGTQQPLRKQGAAKTVKEAIAKVKI